jgi:DNA polymerase-3 subunit delta
MYQKEFENLLKTNPPRALLLYGENNYLISSYIQHYINITDTAESLRTEYYNEYDFKTAKAYLAQSSLFGGANLLIIKRDKKIPKKELDIIIELVNKNPINYFIFEYQGQAKDARGLQKSFSPKKNANWLRVFEPNMRESIEILQRKAQHIGLKIDHYALQHLMLLLNNNLALSANELNKLAILEGKVTAKDIDTIVYSTAPLATEQLLIKLFEKKPIIETMSRLIELGIDEFALLRSSQFFINQIFLFHTFMKINGYIDSKAILGYKLPKQIETERANLALSIKSSTLLQMFEHLLKLELEIKSSSPSSRELLLYGGFIKLQTYL